MAAIISNFVSSPIGSVVNGAKGWVGVGSVDGFYINAFVTISAPGLSSYAQIIDINSTSNELRIRIVPAVGLGPTYTASDVSGYASGTVTQEAQVIYSANDYASLVTSSSSGFSLFSTAAATYYVNAATGSDTNSGLSSSAPFATITKALAASTLFGAFTTTINVYAGTYNEKLDITAWSFISNSRLIDIVGQDWTAVTPTTGIASGTFDAVFTGTPSRFIAEVAGAGWTVDDLAGKFVKITSGTNTGTYIPIVANSATSLTLSLLANTTTSFGRNIQSATFEIVTSAQILTRVGSEPHLISVHGGHMSGTNIGNGVRIANFDIQAGSASAGIFIGSNGSLRLEQSVVATSGAPTQMIGMAANGGVLYLLQSLVVVNSGGSGLTLSGLGLNVQLRNSAIRGGNFGVNQSGAGLCNVTLNSTVFANQTFDAVVTRSARISAGGALYTFGTSQTFVRSLGQYTDIVMNNSGNLSNAFVITGKSVAAVAVQQNSASSRASFNNITTLGTSVIIDACANGVVLETAHNSVDLTGATITNSTAWGVNIAGNKLAGFNQVITSSTTTMSGNASGDFTLDGTAATSLATLRADPDKDLQDTTRFNRLAEY